MGVGLLVVAAVVVVVAVAVGRAYLQQQRRQALARFAVLQGLQYAPEDPFGLLGLPFELLQKGDGRGLENVLWGTWSQTPVQLFDYWYYDERRDGKGHTSRTYHRFSCAVVSVEAACPHLVVARENVLTRLADGLGMDDLQFESEEFNRTFNVRAADARFAYAFLDARMMAWLLAHGDGFAFEVHGGHLLVTSGRRAPMDLVPLLGTVRDLREQIPPVVFSLYPKSR